MKHFKLTAVLAALLLLVACKTDPQPEKIDFKRTENSVTVQTITGVSRLNPVVATSIYDMQVIDLIYSYLANYTIDGDALTPELLTEIPEIRTVENADAPGAYAVDFEILPEATWPNGSPVTGHDYVFTMKAIFNPLVENALRYRGHLTGTMVDIQVEEENPKKFTAYMDQISILTMDNLVNTLPLIPAYIGDPEGKLDAIQIADLLDPDKAETLATSNEALQEFATSYNLAEYHKNLANIVGSGPYSIVDWVDGQRVTLQRKDDWWGDKVSKETHPQLVAYPDEIIFKPIADPNTALAALKAEELDAMSRISSADFEALQKDSITGPRYDLKAVNSFSWYFISINSANPKLSDKRVRKALAYAFDAKEILDKLFLGYGTLVKSPVHPTQAYYNDDLKLMAQDFDKASALLAEAGWEDTNNNGIVDKEIEGERVELSIEYTGSNREASKNMGLIFKENAKQIGVDITIRLLPGQQYLKARRDRAFEVISSASSITPVWNPRQSWHSEGDNRTGFGNAETDALIDEILVTLDDGKRMELYKELQAIMAEEQPVIYLFTPKTTVAVHKRFEWVPLVSPPCFDPRLFKLKESFQ